MHETTAADAALATLRGQVIDIVVGTVFLSVGATACAIAAIRWRRGVRILVLWGIWSGMYGLQTLDQTPTILTIIPSVLKPVMPYVSTTVLYLLLVSALLAWRELTIGKIRFLIDLEILVGLVIALIGIGTFVLGGPANKWMVYNNLLAVFSMLVLLAVVVVPKFASQFLVVRNHRILAAGTVIFALEALYTNLSTVLRYPTLPMVAPLGFAALLFSLGYVALDILFTNERQLLSIETELETARQIQSSILPMYVPELGKLGIAATYHPMTAVAGDFYQFIRTDDQHLGVLVADVSGHGIPAAMIASMIKVAMQSVVVFADDPAQLLGGLNRILSAELRGQLISAAYLWIDTECHSAQYSAAGHPPLLCWKDSLGVVQRIESNGLLFGVSRNLEYPVCSLVLEPRDRFVIYTDGLVEPENARGEAFGDARLEQVIREQRLQPASELSQRLIAELRKWQSGSTSQQDDITPIVIDIL